MCITTQKVPVFSVNPVNCWSGRLTLGGSPKCSTQMDVDGPRLVKSGMDMKSPGCRALGRLGN